MRVAWSISAFVLGLALLALAQAREEPHAEGRIAGTVLDQQGQPLNHIFVHAVSEQTGVYMPTVESDINGKFLIESLEPGLYKVFGESDAAGYPNTAMRFYGGDSPERVVIGVGGLATVPLVLGPVAGVLSGTLNDKATGKAIVSRHAVNFTLKKTSNPEDSILLVGPLNFRWLIPPAVDLTLEVTAQGYKPWFYSAAEFSNQWPLRLESGEERTLTIELEPEVQKVRSR